MPNAAFQAAGAIAFAAGDPVVTNPSHQTDDILLLHAWLRSTSQTIATPSGWTAFSANPVQSTIGRSYFFWKRATSSSEAAPTVDSSGTSQCYARVYVIRNAVPSGDPFEVVGDRTFTTSDPSTLTGITSSSANALIALALCEYDNLRTLSGVTATDPSTLTVNDSTTTADGNDALMAFASAVRSAAGATGNISVDWSGSPDGGQALLVAITRAPDPTYDQDSYRFRNDDGSETTATWRQAVNTADTIALNTRFRLRVAVEETNSVDPANAAYWLEYRQKPSGGSFGSWTTVHNGVPLDDEGPLEYDASANITAGAATTRQIWASATGFVAGQITDEAATTPTVDLGALGKTELEFALIADSANGAANGDVFEFRVVASTVLDTYTNTPSLTISSGGPTTTPVSLSAGLTLTGATTRVATYFRSFSAGLTLTGVVAAARLYARSLTADTPLTGVMSLVRIYPRTLAGDLTLTGALTRVATYPRTLAAGLTLTGTLARLLTLFRPLSADLTLTAVTTKAATFFRTLAAGLTLTGSTAQGRLYLRTLDGSLPLTGNQTLVRVFARPLSASLPLTGTLTRMAVYVETLAVTLTLTGTLSRIATFFRSLAADLPLTGVVVRLIRYTLAAGLTLTATLTSAFVKFVNMAVSLLLTGSVASATIPSHTLGNILKAGARIFFRRR